MASFSEIIHFALLLKCFSTCLSETETIRRSLDDDLLLPYSGSHGSSRSHLHVRDCQPVVHGNVTYETWAARNRSRAPVVDSNIFVSSISTYSGEPKWVSGHITVVHDPLRAVSVMEPGGPGGCRGKRRATVEETIRGKKCIVAQNGGYFDMTHGDCLGNVVSDGKLVRTSGGIQNAQFGIRRDGTLVFGYLSEEDVLDEVNPFVQLISGVMWLLRAGEVYITESLQAECNATQGTGTFQYFVDVVSGRTAVGHDAQGRLILFHTDGQTGIRGMNLWEVADFLRERGVINAINLDGGGSATHVLNGALANYPSDHCASDPMWRCPRSVSTVLCVHEPVCQPDEDCGGPSHGRCEGGHCVCQPGWSGPACDTLTCQPPECGHHGVCTQTGCACDAGWVGANCSQVCAEGFYGDGCNQTCTCANGGSCDPVHGRCTCPAGFHGDSCEAECPLGFYGQQCQQECDCPDMCPCDSAMGSCNVTYTAERNSSLHRAGHCLATQMWRGWKVEDEARRPRPLLTETSWLILTAVLSSVLLVSVGATLILACRKCELRVGVRRLQEEYSYQPLQELNGDSTPGGGGGSWALRAPGSKIPFQPDNSVSEDSA